MRVDSTKVFPAIRRILFFVSSVVLVLVFHFLVGSEHWYFTLGVALVLTITFLVTYNSKEGLFPKVVKR